MSFHISFTSVEQVKTFVALAARQPFEVRASSRRRNINAKHILSMFCLDFSRPVLVHAECSAEEFAAFRRNAKALEC